MGKFAWKALSPGSHPSVSRLPHETYIDNKRKKVCPCQVPDEVCNKVFAQMFFAGGSTDEWVVQMIHLASVGFTD